MSSNKLNATERVRAALEEDIKSGLFGPGDKLEEVTLSHRFGVSRTPVREALLQLASLGHVEMKARQGATVARLSVHEVVAMMEVMTELEGLSARLAARRMSPDDRKGLKSFHASMSEIVEKGDVDKYSEANKALHEMIYAGAKNGFLQSRVMDVRARLSLYRRYPWQRTGQMAISYGEHARIVDAILRGDDQKADEEMQAHISTGGNVFADLVAQLR